MNERSGTFEVPGGGQVPEEMRKLLEQGIAQAREGFGKALNAASDAMSDLESKSGIAQEKASELRQKSLALTEASMAAAFDHVQKLVGAKTIDEVMKHQADYLAQQFAAVQSYIRQVGEEIERNAKTAGAELMQEAQKMQASAKDAFEKNIASGKDALKSK